MNTPVFAAIEHEDRGIWIGPSPIDGVQRIHAFRHLPDRALAVIVVGVVAAKWRELAKMPPLAELQPEQSGI